MSSLETSGLRCLLLSNRLVALEPMGTGIVQHDSPWRDNFEVQVPEGPDGLKRAPAKLRRGLGTTGVLGEIRGREFACKPSEKRRRKRERARRRRVKDAQRVAE